MNLQLVKQYNFQGMNLDTYVTDEKDKVWLTRRQIGEALEYAQPSDGIAIIHGKYPKRLDPFSDTIDLIATDGKSYETTVYSHKGIFEICRHSAKTKADSLIDKIWEIADEVLKTGSYGDPQMNKLDKMLETATTMLQTQIEASKQIQSHEERINTIEDKANKAEKALSQKELPPPRLLNKSSTRQKINQLVKDYVQANNADYAKVWNRVYKQFSLVHHMNLYNRARKSGLSNLEYLEHIDRTDELYAIAHRLLS